MRTGRAGTAGLEKRRDPGDVAADSGHVAPADIHVGPVRPIMPTRGAWAETTWQPSL